MAKANTYSFPAKNPSPGREYTYITINEDGSRTTSYGPTPNPEDVTDLGSKTSAARPESKPKAEPKAKPTVNSAVKNAAKPATKPLSKLDLVPDMGEGVVSKIKSKFTDSPFNPKNAALAYKGRTLQANPVAYAANAYGMGSGGGYMPVGEGTADLMRVENHPEDLIPSLTTVVPINEKGTVYLDPKLGVKNTEVVTDPEGWKYYRNAQTGQFEPLDYDAPYKDYSPLPRVKEVKESYPINGIPTINDILGGALSMPKSDTPLPVPPMQYDSDANKPLPPMSMDSAEVPSGKVVVGPDTETKPVTKPTVSSVVRPKRVSKPTVVNNTSVQTPTSTPVVAPTLSSVTSQAVRHNGGFDNYRRESVLSALRAAGGISPAEAVQRGIIPMEALNYV